MSERESLWDDRHPDADEAACDDDRELLGLWMSRLMFGGLVAPELQPLCVETRSFEEFVEEHRG